MGPKTLAFRCLIALASATGSVAHAATINYNLGDLLTNSFGGPFLYSLDGTLGPNGKNEFGVFDVDKLFQRPLSRPFQFLDFNIGNFNNGNSLPGISDGLNSGLTNGNSNTGLYGPNDYLTLAVAHSGNTSNTSTSSSPAITSSDQSATLTFAQNSFGVSGPLITGATSVKSFSAPKGIVDGTLPLLNLPLGLLNSIPPTSESAVSTGSAASTSGGVSAAPLPDALSLFATGLGGLGLLAWLRKRKVSGNQAFNSIQ